MAKVEQKNELGSCTLNNGDVLTLRHTGDKVFLVRTVNNPGPGMPVESVLQGMDKSELGQFTGWLVSEGLRSSFLAALNRAVTSKQKENDEKA